MKTKIVILTGKKQSGKSTSVSAIKQHYKNLHVEEYSFADPLKRFLINVFGLSYEQCYGTDEEKNSSTNIIWGNLPFSVEHLQQLWSKSREGKLDPSAKLTAREAMQFFGSEICRAMYADCWANATLNNIIRDDVDLAVISDARFPNEIDIFKEYNPLVVRFTRNVYKSNHISEIALDNYDFKSAHFLAIIDNINMPVDTKNKWVVDAVNTFLESE